MHESRMSGHSFSEPQRGITMTTECTPPVPKTDIGRRNFIRLGLAAAASATILTPEESWAIPRVPGRRLSFYNLHTSEKVSVEYWARGTYVRDGLKQVNKLMRDHRNGAVHPIDPKLLDVLFQLQRMTGTKGPIHIVSAYRSPATNAALREADPEGVARRSYHMEGKAVDLRFPGVQLSKLHRAALSLRAGGVGYYPESNFVHVDVGPVRHWFG